jgi:ferredoxin
MMPNPVRGGEPIVVFAEECWYCGGCVEECPRDALTLVTPAKQRLSTVWLRKDTGEEFRVGMRNPPPPNLTPPSGNR